MAEIGALGAVKMIRGLRCHEKRINEVADYVMLLVETLRRTRLLLNHSHLIEKFDREHVICKAHWIEDVLETFAFDVAVMLQENEAGLIRRFIRKHFPELNYGFVLKNIKKNILDFDLDLHDNLKLFLDDVSNELPLVASQGQRRLRQTYPRGIEENFVGRTDELQKLVSLVVEKKTRVISIWGKAGLGKTTIAAKINEHRDIRRNFIAFAWVCFSQGCQLSSLLLNILSQLDPFGIFSLNVNSKEGSIIDKCKEVQRQMECLIVLDNIEDTDQWTQLSPALEMEGRRSVILLTTREENIANNVGYPHKLRLLNEDEAWDLLKKHAFPGRNGPDSGVFPRLGKEMARKCGYLPSAISRLGTILSSKNSLHDWEMVNNDDDNVLEYIQGNHIEGDEQLVSSLDLKYANLPYYLKQCFLYLGNFSKEEEIDVEDLFFLWIAEGMVSSENEVRKKTPDLISEEKTTRDMANDDGEEMTQDIANEDKEEITPDVPSEYREESILYSRNEEEKTRDIANIDWLEMATQDIATGDKEVPALDIAEKYLTELASRGVVCLQQDELSGTRKSQSCFLCSPVRELSSWEEENEGFHLEIIDSRNGKWPVLRFDFLLRARRLAIHFNQQSKYGQISFLPTQYVRSLFLLNSDKKFVEFASKQWDFGEYKLLRVLNFLRCKFDGRKLPKGIDRLFNLRYLGLLYCDLDELPSSISNLRNLRVLNVRVLENNHLGIPNVLHKLVLLNQLRLPYCTNRERTPKLVLDDLLELEALFGFNSLIHDLDSLSKLNKLRHLGAHAYSNDSLKLLVRFITSHGTRIRTNFIIENTCDFTSKEGVEVLQDVLMCPNLHLLTLSMVLVYELPDCGRYISTDLTQLKLIGCRIKEDPMEVLGKFLNLQKLCLGFGAFVGREMTVQAYDFPSLAYLQIRSLPYFEEWRLDEGAMLSLSDLIIRRCPRLKMIPDGLKFISNLKNMEIELAPEAFVDVSEEEYLQKFDFVPALNIRRVNDPCSTIY